MVRELLQKSAGVTLVLKKVPVPETPPQVLPPDPARTCFQTPVISCITLFLVVPQTSPQALGSPQLRISSLALAPLSPR